MADGRAIVPFKARDDDAMSLRSPPVNFDAEIQLIGAILSNNRAYELVADFLRPTMFADARHARIFEACGRLVTRGQMASAVTLKNYFEQDSTLTEIGGAQYLSKLAGAAVTVINAGQHGRIVEDLWLRRQTITLGEDLITEAYSHNLETGAAELSARYAQKLDALNEEGGSDGGPMQLSHGLDQAVSAAQDAFKSGADGVTGVSTGLFRLDKKLRGLHGSDLIVLAGRPGMGKTACAVTVAYNAALDYAEVDDGNGNFSVARGAKGLIFSLEMSAVQLSARILAGITGISADRQRGGELTFLEVGVLQAARQEFGGIPLFIDDSPGLTLSKIRQRARRLARGQGLGLIVIDYLQLIEADGGFRSDDNRTQEIGRITRGLKALAKELNVPIILLSQLSRDVEKRDDKRPRLADLRDSGTIEQDADTVLFVYRHEVYLGKEEPQKNGRQKGEDHDRAVNEWIAAMDDCRGIAEIIAEKNRHGPTGTVRQKFMAERTWFGNIEGSTA